MNANSFHGDGQPNNLPDCVLHLRNIDVEDLQYVERDLCFYELKSLGFLLFGTTRANAEFILQKLLVLYNTIVNVAGDSGNQSRATNLNCDLLRKYASINPSNWRATLVEALTIIDARRVLRKLGFSWEPLRQHYLPHIAELSLHVQPLLKALYKMCERLPSVATGRLILEINEQHQRQNTHLRFYESSHLEVYLLHWITLGIISVGNETTDGANVQVLIDYFKLNENYQLKALLVSTVSNNATKITNSTNNPPVITTEELDENLSNSVMSSAKVVENNANITQKTNQNHNDNDKAVISSSSSAIPHNGISQNNRDNDIHERYTVRQAHAGLLLIINQKKFTEDDAPDLKHLLPSKTLGFRTGTDVDKQRIIKVFTSFGYRSVEYEDLKHTEMLYRIDETVKRSFLHDSLIVCILSHGIDGCVYGSNSIPVEIADIEQIMATDKLRGKPKMLIIQACQTDGEATTSNDTNGNNPTKNRRPQRRPRHQQPTNHSDMIKAMSTVAGFAAMRHTQQGTWFIDAICKMVDELGDHKHMLDILIAVQRDVVDRRGNNNEHMVPQTSNTLTKYFYLPRRCS